MVWGTVLFFLVVLIVAALNVSIIHSRKEMRARALKEESTALGRNLDESAITCFFSASYRGSIPNIGEAFSAEIYIIGSGLYIHNTITSKSYRIEISSIEEVKLLTAALPYYIMNLDAASLLANEMTRRQIGDSILITFIDMEGEFHAARLSKLGKTKAREVVTILLSLNGTSD